MNLEFIPTKQAAAADRYWPVTTVVGAGGVLGLGGLGDEFHEGYRGGVAVVALAGLGVGGAD